jgi:hypothetical protein
MAVDGWQMAGETMVDGRWPEGDGSWQGEKMAGGAMVDGR